MHLAGPAGRTRPEPFEPDSEASGASAALLLRAARALIEDERTWTTGIYHTLGGKHCAVGALRAAARGIFEGRYGRAVRQEADGILLGVAARRGFESVETMNDRSTHAQVLAALDAATACAESREPVLD